MHFTQVAFSVPLGVGSLILLAIRLSVLWAVGMVIPFIFHRGFRLARDFRHTQTFKPAGRPAAMSGALLSQALSSKAFTLEALQREIRCPIWCVAAIHGLSCLACG